MRRKLAFSIFVWHSFGWMKIIKPFNFTASFIQPRWVLEEWAIVTNSWRKIYTLTKSYIMERQAAKRSTKQKTKTALFSLDNGRKISAFWISLNSSTSYFEVTDERIWKGPAKVINTPTRNTSNIRDFVKQWVLFRAFNPCWCYYNLFTVMP